MSPRSATKPVPAYDKAWAYALIERIVRECPERRPTSEDERKAQILMVEELERLGMETEIQPFEFNENLYANVALHFGLGSLGTFISPALPLTAFALHLGTAASYWADSTRRAYVLRRLFPFRESQNVVATLPAEGRPRLRIVLVAHADAAFTGRIFEADSIEAFSSMLPKPLNFMKRTFAVAVRAQLALAGIDLLRAVFGPLTLPLRPIEQLLTLPSLLVFLGTVDVLLRNRVVPGAADNLTGVAALPILASRLRAAKPKDVELVFAVTGCEEASLGGCHALLKRMDGAWDRKDTVFVGLDTLSNGDLQFLEYEGEVCQTRIPDSLARAAMGVAASDPRFAEVKGFEVPVGGSDIAAALALGWDGICMSCIDPKLGSARHYHVPSDTPENLDMDKFMLSIDFTEKLVERIIADRLGQ